jgi:very-short-patch-repair endonuclease
MWGIRTLQDGAFDVTVVGRRSESRDGIRIHQVAEIDPRDTRSYRGIPITSPARTLLDIACDLSEREFERAFDEAIVKRLTSLTAIRAMLLANQRRRGAERVRQLAFTERATTMTRSEAEEVFLSLVREARLPSPETNARIGAYEVDFCWRAERVIVEIDGHTFHSSRAALERDHRRDADLQQMGFIVIRVTWRQLRRESLRVVAWVASALARRAA